LAFGNGAPDIFSAIAAISTSKEGNISLAIGALFGAGIFVSTIVVGAICITTPFVLTSRPFLRDVIFYCLAVVWTFSIIWKGRVYLGEAIGFIALYAVYVIVVVLGHYIYQKRKKQRLKEEKGETDDETEDEKSPLMQDQNPETNRERSDTEMKSIDELTGNMADTSDEHGSRDHDHSEDLLSSQIKSSHLPTISPADMDSEALRNLQLRRRRLRIKRLSYGIASALDIGETVGVALLGHEAIAHPRPRHSTLHDDETRELSVPLLSESPSVEEKERDHPVIFAVKSLKPLKYEEWRQERIVWKILDICKVPILFLLQLTTPVVDYEEDCHGWNKWLNVWHCISAPVFITFATNGYGINLNGVFPLWAFVLMVGVAVAMVVALTSKPYVPPVYHALFSYLGFAVSMVWIYVVANEIVNGLQVIGVVFNIHSGILGLTFLAWANSIGDFISDLTMAKQGFPRMGVAACFGGPLLNLLLGFGIGTTITCFKSKGYVMKLAMLSSVEFICTMFLLASLVFSLVIVTTVLRFKVNRFYGMSLVCLYLVFLTIAILGEQNIIKSPRK
jgi:sodium/potassium/calcium exchanger 6